MTVVISNHVKMGVSGSNNANFGSGYGGDFHFRVNGGDICEVGFRFNALTGAPTTAKIEARWQFAPLVLRGLDEDTVSATTGRQWFDVLKTDARWADQFVDEQGHAVSDWPAFLFDSTAGDSVPVYLTRKIKVPANFLVRATMRFTLAGGSSPVFTFAQWQTQYSKLA